LIHLFGGIGGENKEFTPAGTVSGHFAYGLARVIEEPLAQEPQFDIQYQQIYAHNSGGLISGTHDWSSYTGNMQRGWLGMRPISDVVVKLDSFIQPF
jgi:predicted Abi (CAAX) family protease